MGCFSGMVSPQARSLEARASECARRPRRRPARSDNPEVVGLTRDRRRWRREGARQGRRKGAVERTKCAQCDYFDEWAFQIPPPQPISATKKDIAPKTRDFLGFSSFFAVFLVFLKMAKQLKQKDIITDRRDLNYRHLMIAIKN